MTAGNAAAKILVTAILVTWSAGCAGYGTDEVVARVMKLDALGTGTSDAGAAEWRRRYRASPEVVWEALHRIAAGPGSFIVAEDPATRFMTLRMPHDETAVVVNAYVLPDGSSGNALVMAWPFTWILRRVDNFQVTFIYHAMEPPFESTLRSVLFDAVDEELRSHAPAPDG